MFGPKEKPMLIMMMRSPHRNRLARASLLFLGLGLGMFFAG